MKRTHFKKSKKIYKYQVLSTILLFASLLLMILSICPFVYPKLVGILQGLSTGLLSGMVLLLITGIKTQEQKNLQKTYDAIHMCNLSFPIIFSAFSNLEQYLFHNNKSSDNYEELYNRISNAHLECQNEYIKLMDIDSTFIPEDICHDLKEYLKIFRISLDIIGDSIIKFKINKDKDALTDILPAFYTIINNAITLHFKITREEIDINYDKNQIDNYLF